VNAQTVIDDNRLRPGLRVVYSEQEYVLLPLTPEEAVDVELATVRESWPPRRWPRGWQHSFGPPESWMFREGIW
jgi:hypothetical protein